MSRTQRRTWLLSAAALVAGVALLAAACGGGGGNKASQSSTPSAQTGTTGTAGTPGGGKTFASFRVTWDAPDYVDPGLAYTVAGWQIMWNVYEGLLGYKHVSGPEGTTLIPYLAEDMPKVSSDGLTYKFTLRSGLKYSDGKPVKASDFQSTIERDYKINSPGVGFFSAIAGADQYGKTKKGHISGIVVDDAARTITVKLSHPEGDMLNILATQFAAFVPPGTPASDQSTKGIPATGPYMIQTYNPSRSFTVVRNPNFNGQIPDIPKGNPDKILGTIITDGSAALQSVLSGKSDYDFIVIPNDRLQQIQQKYADQLKLYTSPNTYYFFLNTRVAPFDKLEARQAVNYAIDRNALVQIFGGLGRTTQNVMPPNYPSYKRIDVYTHNVAKAKQLVQSSGTAGSKVTVWADNTPPSAQVGEYLTGVLNNIGYKASLKTLSHQVYFTTIGNQATKAQTGWADWYQDYPNPIDWFDVLFNGNRITQTHNNNYGNSNFPDVNSLIEKLKKEPLNDQTNSQWADVDKKLIADHAAAAPYLNRVGTDFFGTKVDTSCYVFHVLYQFDFSTICMK